MNQLELWPRQNFVMCEHCGKPTRVKSMFSLDSTSARVLSAIRKLSKHGEPVNASDVARLAHCHQTTATRHLERLHRLHKIVEPVPKGTSLRAWRIAG